MQNQDIMKMVEAEWKDRLKAAVEAERQACSARAHEYLLDKARKGKSDMFAAAQGCRDAIAARQSL